jgi:hypothetical protein
MDVDVDMKVLVKKETNNCCRNQLDGLTHLISPLGWFLHSGHPFLGVGPKSPCPFVPFPLFPLNLSLPPDSHGRGDAALYQGNLPPCPTFPPRPYPSRVPATLRY